MLDKIVKKQGHKYQHFFFCMKLQQGVVISAVIWLIIGSLAALCFLRFAFFSDKNAHTLGYLQPISIFNAVVFISISCLALFGLMVFFFFGKSIKLFRIYSYATWFISVFSVTVIALVTVAAILISKNDFSYACAREQDQNPNNMDAFMESYENCSDIANKDVFRAVVLYVIIISANLYFSIILQFYIRKNVVKERKERRRSRRRELIERKHSYSRNSKIDIADPIEQFEPKEIVIKVDHGYDNLKFSI